METREEFGSSGSARMILPERIVSALREREGGVERERGREGREGEREEV